MTGYTAAADSILSDQDARESGTTDCELWISKINKQLEDEKAWREEARIAIAVYEATRELQSLARYKGRPTFNIFHSNVETLVPAVYNSTPLPDVRRKFGDKDPVARLASQVAERALSANLDCFDFDGLMKAAVRSAAVAGRGASRVRYQPHFKTATDINNQEFEAVAHEEANCDSVRYDRLVVGPADEWDQVPWIAFGHDLTKDDIGGLLSFGLDRSDKAKVEAASTRLKLLPFGVSKLKSDDPSEERATRGVLKTVPVWEVWDKASKSVIFICEKDAKLPLCVVPDPLKLSKFFPIPKPIQQLHRVSSLIPMCPHNVYQDLVEEIDDVTQRIKIVVDDMRVRALADPKLNADIEKLKSATDGDIVSSSVAEMFGPNGADINKVIAWWPVDQDVKVLQQLLAHREAVKQIIYEVTGLSDILRGATQASETATAQQIKATWGSQRVQEFQAEVQRYARDLFRLMAEVIFNRFQDETIRAMTLLPEPVDAKAIAEQATQQFQAQAQAQQAANDNPAVAGAPGMGGQPAQAPPPPQLDPNALAQAQQQAVAEAQQQAEQAFIEALQVLRSQLRYYRVDIETDSTIKANLAQDQEQVTNFVGMTGQYWQAATALAQLAPPMLPYMVEIWAKIATKSYKLGKGADDILDKLLEAAHQAVEQGLQGQSKGPSPEEMAAQQQAQQREADMQAQAQQHEKDMAASQQAHDQTLASISQSQAQAQANHDAEMSAREQAHEAMMAEHERAMSLLDQHADAMSHDQRVQLEGLKAMGLQMREQHKQAADERKAKLAKALPPKGGRAAA